MDFLGTTGCLFFAGIFTAFCFLYKKNSTPEKLPTAPYCLPLIGHSWLLLNIFTDVISYLNKCGPLFQLWIFGQRWIYLCDNAHIRDFFVAKENELSFFDVFYLQQAFGSKGLPYSKIKDIIRIGYSSLKPEKYCADVLFVALQEINQRLRGQIKIAGSNKSCWDLLKTMVERYVDGVTAQIILGTSLGDAGYKSCADFNSYFHLCAPTSMFIPADWIHFLTLKWKNKLRGNVLKQFVGEIEKYRENEEKDDSKLIRTAVDKKNELTGLNLTNEEVSGIICALMLGGNENTSVLILNILYLLATHPTDLKRCMEETAPYLEKEDSEGLINEAQYLEAVIHEAARLTFGIFAPQRISVKSTQLGQHVIPKGTTVILNLPLIYIYGKDGAGNEFKPERFLIKPPPFPWFGMGKHLCPAKQFTMNIIKVGVAIFIKNFQINQVQQSSLNYMIASTFAQWKFKAKITSI